METQLHALESLGVTQNMYEAMLYPLVESSLPEEVFRTWERNGLIDANNEGRLQGLMKFLKSEVDGDTRISMALVGLGLEEPKTNKPKSKISQEETATCLFTGIMKPEMWFL
ncbi:unnamed protein product [Allacma fusca]|uniref:Uncharacterized protein n=1 Tax=Allacma fusca TaxID=39272 RepID=A0A8J2PMK6_9HEXA|nr:unnamed protein product [Allacma fusca]